MSHRHRLTIRSLVALLSLSLLVLTACGTAQSNQSPQRIYRIGKISTGPRFDVVIAGFDAGMVAQGYIEGKNVTYLYDGAADTPEKREATAQKMVAEKVDLIVTFGSQAAQAAKKAVEGTSVPVIFMPVVDPIQAGLVQSIRNPEGNLTGVIVGADLYGKELEWLQKIAPNIKRVYVPYDSPNNPASIFAVKAMKDAAQKLGLELVFREIKNADDVSAAIDGMADKMDAVCLVPGSTLVTARIDDFIKASLQYKLPLSATVSDWVKLGALMSYSFSDEAAGKQSARLADRLLKGAKPADLPVETTEYFLSVNLKAAQAIGLTVTDDILRQATTIVR